MWAVFRHREDDRPLRAAGIYGMTKHGASAACRAVDERVELPGRPPKLRAPTHTGSSPLWTQVCAAHCSCPELDPDQPSGRRHGGCRVSCGVLGAPFIPSSSTPFSERPSENVESARFRIGPTVRRNRASRRPTVVSGDVSDPVPVELEQVAWL